MLCLIVAASCVLTCRAQNIVFNDAFTGDALNPATYPTPTPTATGWVVASNKASPAPVETGGTLTINMAGTSSGFVETQALFSPTPIQLLPGTYLEFTATFIPTNVLTSSSDNLVFGLFNSQGSAPVSGLLNSGLSNSLTTYSTGGAKSWLGYNANIPLTGASPRMTNRNAQTAANNTVQDVVFGSQSASVGYTTPAGTNFSVSGTPATTFTNGNTYTVDYKLSLSADGNTLTAQLRIYNGTGITGTGANPLVSSYSGTITGANVLTKAFDAFAFGWRADAGTANPSNLQLLGLVVSTTGGKPWFTTQPPANTAVSLGSSLTLTTAVGGVVSSYQWQVSTDGGAHFTNLDVGANPSAATATLTVNNVQTGDAGIYHLSVTNAAGSTVSSDAVVTVTSSAVAPAIVTAPSGATVLGGTPYTFSVTANGTSPLSYQWLKSTDGTTYAPIAGATNATYTIPSTSLADEGSYEVTVTNVAGQVTSAPATLTVNQPLTITVQPVGASVNQGGDYTLSATAVGRPTPTYQWYQNGVLLPGVTASTFAIVGATGANSGLYTVTASNSAGDSVTSTSAAVAVISASFTATAFTPGLGSAGSAPDTRLTLTFNQPVAVGLSGQIRIYDAANATIPVDTIDLETANARGKTLRAGNTASTQALPVQNKTVGGLTNFNYYPLTVSGATATIYPRNNVLTYGKTYFVTIDPGVFVDGTGLSFAGLTGPTGWTFSTKFADPDSTSTRLVVAADGSGDFNTVQGALDWIPSANTTPRTIFIRSGTYFEEVYFTAKHNLTFLGEDRAQSIIAYPNNNNFNNVSGSYHRMVFQADRANNVAFVNLTIQNTTPHGGSQAEALVLNGTTTAQALVTNVDLLSFQDTLLINGQAYLTDSHISGDVDFMWGNGPAFFSRCRLTALTSGGYYTQIRNGSTIHGFVFSECVLDAAPGVTGFYLSRIDPNPSGFPYSEVVWLNSVIGTVSGSTYSTHVAPTGWLLNNTTDQTATSAPNIHFWEYNSHFPDGTPANVASRIGASRQLTLPADAATITNYSTPSYVLGASWTPQMAPIVATPPVARSVDSGNGFTLSVTAFGVPAVTYQWTRNGTPIPGATGSTYTVPASAGTDAGTYAVVVSNGVNSITTAAVPVVVHGAAPVIALQPASTSALRGTTATLNGWAVGDGPFTYQWSKAGAPIADATNLSLRLTGLGDGDAGSYTVAVSNAGGTTVSDPAVLTIVTPAAALPTVPTIPTGRYDVTTYGAVGDGTTDNTTKIQAAINAASAAGGGTVEFPPAAAAYLSGPITIPSNLDLQVDRGAMLQALPFLTYPRSLSSPAHFITIASGASNVEFSGGGIIDGNGAPWWAAYDAGTISGRPRLVQITRGTNLLFSATTFQNSPNFNLAFSSGNTNVTIFGVSITAPGDSPNTDGIDSSGVNFLIQNCYVSVGDDNVVAKPGSVFCRNQVIADCRFGTGHGVSIGGQTNVGLDGMYVMNCTFNGTDTGIRMKADPTQGGPVQNVVFTNLTMTNVTYPILFYSYYNQLGSPGAKSGSSQITPARVLTWNATPPNSLASATIPTWRNIVIDGLTATGAGGYSTIWGLPLADALIANITLNNVTISGGAGLELYDATNVQLTGNTSVGPIVTANALGISGQPQSRTATVGDTVTFSATVVGASGVNNTAPTYRWSHNGAPLTDGPQSDGSTISGALTMTLSIANIRATSAGSYALTASNALDGYNVSTSTLVPGSLPVSATSSAATLTVTPLPATLTLWPGSPGGSARRVAYDGTPKLPTVTTDPSGLPVAVTFNGSTTPPTGPGTYAVVATVTDPNYRGTTTGTLVISATAQVRHAPTLSGSIDGSLQMFSGESLTLAGMATLSGDLLVPGTPTIVQNTNPGSAGTLDGSGVPDPQSYTITLNPSAVLRYIVRRTDPLAMPVVTAPPLPIGTRNVALNAASQTAGDFTTLRNLTLSGSAGFVAVPPGTYGSFTASGNTGFILGVVNATEPAVYNLQSLGLNVLPGAAQLQVVGPVIINLPGGIILNGATGSAAHPEWLTLRIATGGLTISGTNIVHATVIAPNGTVTLNNAATLDGTVTSDRLTLNGTSLLQDPGL